MALRSKDRLSWWRYLYQLEPRLVRSAVRTWSQNVPGSESVRCYSDSSIHRPHLSRAARFRVTRSGRWYAISICRCFFLVFFSIMRSVCELHPCPDDLLWWSRSQVQMSQSWCIFSSLKKHRILCISIVNSFTQSPPRNSSRLDATSLNTTSSRSVAATGSALPRLALQPWLPRSPMSSHTFFPTDIPFPLLLLIYLPNVSLCLLNCIWKTRPRWVFSLASCSIYHYYHYLLVCTHLGSHLHSLYAPYTFFPPTHPPRLRNFICMIIIYLTLYSLTSNHN